MKYNNHNNYVLKSSNNMKQNGSGFFARTVISVEYNCDATTKIYFNYKLIIKIILLIILLLLKH